MLLLLVLFLPNKHYTLSLVTSEMDLIVVVKSNQMALRGNTQLHSSVQLLIAVRSSFLAHRPETVGSFSMALSSPSEAVISQKVNLTNLVFSTHRRENDRLLVDQVKKEETFSDCSDVGMSLLWNPQTTISVTVCVTVLQLPCYAV